MEKLIEKLIERGFVKREVEDEPGKFEYVKSYDDDTEATIAEDIIQIDYKHSYPYFIYCKGLVDAVTAGLPAFRNAAQKLEARLKYDYDGRILKDQNKLYAFIDDLEAVNEVLAEA